MPIPPRFSRERQSSNERPVNDGNRIGQRLRGIVQTVEEAELTFAGARFILGAGAFGDVGRLD